VTPASTPLRAVKRRLARKADRALLPVSLKMTDALDMDGLRLAKKWKIVCEVLPVRGVKRPLTLSPELSS